MSLHIGTEVLTGEVHPLEDAVEVLDTSEKLHGACSCMFKDNAHLCICSVK